MGVSMRWSVTIKLSILFLDLLFIQPLSPGSLQKHEHATYGVCSDSEKFNNVSKSLIGRKSFQ